MKKSVLSLLAVSFTFTSAARACDACAIYTANVAQGISRRGLYLGAAEQFTHLGTLQFEGSEVSNEVDQHLDNSITQAIVGYAFNERFSLQINVPYIYRSFRRPEGFKIDDGTESGLGDLSVVGNFVLISKETSDVTFRWMLLGGVKFPTGDSGRIAEELHEMEIEGAPESGIHGHDLTLGSGSVDGVIGTSVHLRYKRLFVGGWVQYAIRSEGDYDYRFANELTWSAGPGAYLFVQHDFSVALRAAVSGEAKGRDTFRGETAEDTGMTAVFVGPSIAATFRENLSTEVGIDLPVVVENTALQAVPDYKIRAAFTWRF